MLHLNQTNCTFADDPAIVGEFDKDVDETTLEPILQYYDKDMTYLGYGPDKINWKLTQIKCVSITFVKAIMYT